MPEDYLKSLSPQEREAMWGRHLANPRPGHTLLVIEVDRVVAGFTAVGPANQDLGHATLGELFAMNLDPDFWGRGLGKSLLQSATHELGRLGYTEAILWVIPENARARRLYEAAGWSADGGQQTQEVLGVTVNEVRYRRSLAAGADDWNGA